MRAYRTFDHDITDGNISTTSIMTTEGGELIYGYIGTSPGSDYDATVQVTINGTYVLNISIYPATQIPIILPLISSSVGTALTFSTVVSGSDGHYGLLLGVQ